MSMFDNGEIIEALAKEYLGFGVLFSWKEQDILVLYNEISWKRYNRSNIEEVIQLGKVYRIKLGIFHPQKKAIMGSIRHLDDTKNPVLNIKEGDKLLGIIVNIYGDIGIAELDGEITGVFKVENIFDLGDEIYFRVLSINYDLPSLNVEPCLNIDAM